MSPCRICEAKCCKYFALELDTPRSKEDFEKIRWYIAHKGVTVFVDSRKWFLDVANECRHLTKDHRCEIYDKRPLVCRDHSHYDCERDTDVFDHDHTFKTLEDLDRYLDKRFRRKPRK